MLDLLQIHKLEFLPNGKRVRIIGRKKKTVSDLYGDIKVGCIGGRANLHGV